MTKTGYHSATALAMARAQQRLAEKYQDEALASHAGALEERALQALKEEQPELPPLN